MKAMRGNSSNLASFSNLFKSFSNLSDTHQIYGHGCSNLLKIRVFSSFDGHGRNGNSRRNDRSDFNGGRNDYDDNNSNNNKFSGRDRGSFSDGRNARGDRQRPQFGGQNGSPDRNFRREGRSNERDRASRPIGRDGDRGNMKLSDDFFKSDKDGEGGGTGSVNVDGGFEGKSDYQPSVRELLNSPSKGEQRGGKEDNDFLEKFKLGGVGKKEEGSRSNGVHSSPPPQEEKMEALEDANEIFNKMKKSGLIPNAVAMLDGLCKDGLVHEAMKLFGLMREKGTMPEVVVYTAVVEGFCQAQKLDDAKRVFKKMQDSGIVPNAFSYTVLIKGLSKGNRLEEAFDFCVEMLEAGHSPNVPTFTGLVLEFCKEKGLEDAKKVIGMLKQKGFFLDEKAIRVYLDKMGPTSPIVWEAIFGPKKTTPRAI